MTNLEEPVKKYELVATQKQVDTHENLIGKFDDKLDTIINLLQTRPTIEQVDAKIELAVKAAVEKQDLKYMPVVTNNKRLLWGLITTGLSLIASLIMLAIAYFTRGE